MDSFNEMIKKIGEELGIKVTILSEGWTLVLEKDNKIHYITGYQFDLNNRGVGNIIADKGLFWDLLRYKNIPIIEHYVIFHDYDKNKVLDYFNNHHRKIIVKGNIGNAGKEVFMVTSQEELFMVIDNLFIKQYSVSLCPYYDIINEYRVIVLDNKVRNVFGKIKPKIIGDGVNNVRKLACDFNNYYQDHLDKIPNPDYIPKLNEEIELDFRFNLTKGAKSFTNIPNDLKEEIEKLAISVTRKLNITFASVDIIYTKEGELLVLEANGAVTMNRFILQNNNGYNIAYNIYLDAVKLMFK